MRQLQRAPGDDSLCDLHLLEDRRDRDRAVLRREGAETALSLFQLPLTADSVPAACLVPGDGDVNEALEEVALLGRRCAPGVFELLVGGEELAAPDQVEAARQLLRKRP